ncbi:MAG: LapA family protein [Rhodospirillaceae bacterium]|nr:LapA family protein [Rhodospirillaceae bacterium]
MRFLNTLAAVAVAVLVVLFAVSNRGVVVVEVWPFPLRIEAGLYAVILFAVLIGFLIGSVAAWMGGHTKRAELRAARKRMRDIEQSLARTKAEADAARAKAELGGGPKS